MPDPTYEDLHLILDKIILAANEESWEDLKAGMENIKETFPE